MPISSSKKIHRFRIRMKAMRFHCPTVFHHLFPYMMKPGIMQVRTLLRSITQANPVADQQRGANNLGNDVQINGNVFADVDFCETF